MTALRRSALNMKYLSAHVANCEPRSALERESIRHPSPWRERWVGFGIGVAAITIPLMLAMWATRP